MSKTPDFLAFCPRHGFEIHDGSKNECCDQGSVIPILEVATLQTLTPNGITLFKEDFEKLSAIADQSPNPLPGKADAWFRSIGKDLNELIESMKNAADGEEVDGQLEVADEDYWEGYAAAFERGFVLGYEKGFDIGHKLSPKK